MNATPLRRSAAPVKTSCGRMFKKARPAPLTCTALMLALCCVLGTILSCQSTPETALKPVVSFKSVDITALSFVGVKMLATVEVRNNSPLSIPFPEIEWKLLISEKPLINGKIQNDKPLASRAATEVKIPFDVSYMVMFQLISGLVNEDEVPYRVSLNVHYKIPVIGPQSFEISKGGYLPLLKVPALSFSGIKFTSLNLSRVELTLAWKLENKNGFAMALDKLDFNVNAGSNTWASGAVPNAVNVPAHKNVDIPVTVSIASGQIIRDIIALSTSGQALQYTCSGEAALSPLGLKNAANLRLPFNFTGTASPKL